MYLFAAVAINIDQPMFFLAVTVFTICGPYVYGLSQCVSHLSLRRYFSAI
jgi:hypothetical protein